MMPKWEPFTADQNVTMLISSEAKLVKDVYDADAKAILSTLKSGLLN